VKPAVSASDDRLLTVAEVAMQLGLARDTVYGWVQTRRIACVKIGRLVRIRTSEVDRLIMCGTVSALSD
jgi:excisionase family DNA binding protein